jgi:hypothetical protein
MENKSITKLETANNSIEKHIFLNHDFTSKAILKGFNFSGHVFKDCSFQGINLIRN